MSDSRRKRMLRAEIPAELERRGLGADSCKIFREPHWREDPTMDPRDGIVPDDALAARHYYRCNAGHIECARSETKGVLEHLRESVAMP